MAGINFSRGNPLSGLDYSQTANASDYPEEKLCDYTKLLIKAQVCLLIQGFVICFYLQIVLSGFI